MEAESPVMTEGGRLHTLISHWQSEDPTFARTLTTGIGPAQALARLGVRLCLQERYPQAIQVLTAAADLAPADHRILNNLAVVFERASHLPEAIATARRSLALQSHQPDVLLHLANMLKSTHDLPAAEAAYTRALDLEPTSPIAWQMLALLHQEQRRFQEAIHCLLQSAHHGNTSAPVFALLGQLFHQTGNFQKSLHAYAAAAQLDPAHPTYTRMQSRLTFLLDLINNTPVDEALARYRSSLPPTADEESHNIPLLLQTAFSLLSGYGHHEAARRVGQKRIALHPDSPSANYLLKALSGDQSLQRSPDDYLVEYFDAFAAGFDHQLTTLLAYTVPHDLCTLAKSAIGDRKLDILDIGCGTGLCGVEIAPLARILTGVDLSPKMLDIARARNLYHHLFCAEITSFLRTTSARADLLLAADVLIYFGDLTDLFAAIARVLNPNAHVALSIEITDAPTHRLLPSGRFAHNPHHLRKIAAAFGLTERASQPTTLRLEAAAPVPGELILLQKTS
jgi:predicted TPR repeat methyltransferase/Tfp pilus assembly protein PilF